MGRHGLVAEEDDPTPTTTTTTTYIALVPRGLEHVITDMLQQEFQSLSSSTIQLVSIHIVGDEPMGGPTDDRHHRRHHSMDDTDRSSFVTHVRTQLLQHQCHHRNQATILHSQNQRHNDTTQLAKIHSVACATWVGTMEYCTPTTTTTHNHHRASCISSSSSSNPIHVSIGYDHHNHPRNDRIWTVPGQVSGLVGMAITLRFPSTTIDRPIRFVPPDLPYLGPKVALVAIYYYSPGDAGWLSSMDQPHASVRYTARLVQSTIQNDPRCDTEAVHALTWHTCQVCTEGLSVKVLSNDISLGADYFTIDWLSPL